MVEYNQMLADDNYLYRSPFKNAAETTEQVGNSWVGFRVRVRVGIRVRIRVRVE